LTAVNKMWTAGGRKFRGHTLVCNTCKAQWDQKWPGGVGEARRVARGLGWTSVSGRIVTEAFVGITTKTVRDTCPDCTTEEA
jgi:hypothetical protein